MIDHILINSENIFKNIINRSFDVVLISLPIYKKDVIAPFNNRYSNKEVEKNLKKIIFQSEKKLKNNGIIMIYGSPIQLIKIYEKISANLVFRHWIALDILNSIQKKSDKSLKHNHIGILFLTKGDKPPQLDTKNTRVPYLMCPACGRNSKDWGGKKHLMNFKGAGISDVWRDFFKVIRTEVDHDNKSIKLNVVNINKSSLNFEKNRIPKPILDRILSLLDKNKNKILYLEVEKSFIKPLSKINNKIVKKINCLPLNPLKLINSVILGDCIKVMKKWVKKYPNGIFDLVFADPPYNLNKSYKVYDDTLASKEYIDWCNQWLDLCVKLTKPTGSILILNIPKWALAHTTNLNKNAFLQNWIVWDALSTPKGKIMPAHYALLYYTKYPTSFFYNNPGLIDSPEYCLRSDCISLRKKSLLNINLLDDKKEINNKIALSDIWWDVSRIKHKKHRDDHPCQLPDKLMERIIKIFSNKGDLVFDPFAGAGTTAILALKNKRNYCVIEIDPFYKKITEGKLSEILNNGDIFHKSVKKSNHSIYKKNDLEIKVQQLAQRLGRKPALEEFISAYSLNITEIEKLYGKPEGVLKASRISLLNHPY